MQSVKYESFYTYIVARKIMILICNVTVSFRLAGFNLNIIVLSLLLCIHVLSISV